jgi:hypothetical protein
LNIGTKAEKTLSLKCKLDMALKHGTTRGALIGEMGITDVIGVHVNLFFVPRERDIGRTAHKPHLKISVERDPI